MGSSHASAAAAVRPRSPLPSLGAGLAESVGELVGRSRFERALGEEYGLRLGSIDDHQHDGVSPGAGLAYRAGGGAACRLQIREGGGIEVKTPNLEARAKQVAGHRPTHGSKADEGDPLHVHSIWARGAKPLLSSGRSCAGARSEFVRCQVRIGEALPPDPRDVRASF